MLVMHEVSLPALRRGACRTTGGTDIHCVAAHMREHRVRRAVILTDGYVGRPAGLDRNTIRAARLGVALTPGGSTRDDLREVTDHWTQLSLTEDRS